MRLHYYKILLTERLEPIHLYGLGDFHIGHINSDKDKLERIIDRIAKDPYAHVLITGDNVDNRDPSHKYFDFDQVDSLIPMKGFIPNCYRAFQKIIEPISDKIIGIHEGNHDKERQFGHPYTQDICDELDVTFLGYRALTRLAINIRGQKTRQNDYIDVFSTHGSGGGRASGSKINRIEQEALSTQADIYIQGHNHFLSIVPGMMHGFASDGHVYKLLEYDKMFVNAGSFLKSYQEENYSYAEKGSYRPQKTGCALIKIVNLKMSGEYIV